MDEPGRKEPHLGGNPYAYPGDATPVIAAAAPAGAASADETRSPVQFTASAGEYFRIWIVNLALTILTLGIYSAWAKVRKKRYFYGHTLIEGDSFDYRANPLSILKGRIIAVVGALQTGALLNFFDNNYAKAVSVTASVYVLGLVLIYFAPETKGKPLPE